MEKANKEMSSLLKLFLWVLIVLQISILLLNLYVLSAYHGEVLKFLGSTAMISSVFEFIAITLIFKWKKLGVYMFVSVCLFGIVYGFTIFTFSSFINMAVYLIVLGILYYLIHPMWHFMK